MGIKSLLQILQPITTQITIVPNTTDCRYYRIGLDMLCLMHQGLTSQYTISQSNGNIERLLYGMNQYVIRTLCKLVHQLTSWFKSNQGKSEQQQYKKFNNNNSDKPNGSITDDNTHKHIDEVTLASIDTKNIQQSSNNPNKPSNNPNKPNQNSKSLVGTFKLVCVFDGEDLPCKLIENEKRSSSRGKHGKFIQSAYLYNSNQRVQNQNPLVQEQFRQQQSTHNDTHQITAMMQTNLAHSNHNKSPLTNNITQLHEMNPFFQHTIGSNIDGISNTINNDTNTTLLNQPQYRNQALLYSQQQFSRSLALSHDISKDNILQLIQLLQSHSVLKDYVECIISPYQADSQLAYLSKIGYVDIVYTEDSDLIVYGSNSTLFKLDRTTTVNNNTTNYTTNDNDNNNDDNFNNNHLGNLNDNNNDNNIFDGVNLYNENIMMQSVVGFTHVRNNNNNHNNNKKKENPTRNLFIADQIRLKDIPNCPLILPIGQSDRLFFAHFNQYANVIGKIQSTKLNKTTTLTQGESLRLFFSPIHSTITVNNSNNNTNIDYKANNNNINQNSNMNNNNPTNFINKNRSNGNKSSNNNNSNVNNTSSNTVLHFPFKTWSQYDLIVYSILLGCDFLPNIPNCGPKTLTKLIISTHLAQIQQWLDKKYPLTLRNELTSVALPTTSELGQFDWSTLIYNMMEKSYEISTRQVAQEQCHSHTTTASISDLITTVSSPQKQQKKTSVGSSTDSSSFSSTQPPTTNIKNDIGINGAVTQLDQFLFQYGLFYQLPFDKILDSSTVTITNMTKSSLNSTNNHQITPFHLTLDQSVAIFEVILYRIVLVFHYETVWDPIQKQLTSCTHIDDYNYLNYLLQMAYFDPIELNNNNNNNNNNDKIDKIQDSKCNSFLLASCTDSLGWLLGPSNLSNYIPYPVGNHSSKDLINKSQKPLALSPSSTSTSTFCPLGPKSPPILDNKNAIIEVDFLPSMRLGTITTPLNEFYNSLSMNSLQIKTNLVFDDLDEALPALESMSASGGPGEANANRKYQRLPQEQIISTSISMNNTQHTKLSRQSAIHSTAHNIGTDDKVIHQSKRQLKGADNGISGNDDKIQPKNIQNQLTINHLSTPKAQILSHKQSKSTKSTQSSTPKQFLEQHQGVGRSKGQELNSIKKSTIESTSTHSQQSNQLKCNYRTIITDAQPYGRNIKPLDAMKFISSPLNNTNNIPTTMTKNTATIMPKVFSSQNNRQIIDQNREFGHNRSTCSKQGNKDVKINAMVTSPGIKNSNYSSNRSSHSTKQHIPLLSKSSNTKINNSIIIIDSSPEIDQKTAINKNNIDRNTTEHLGIRDVNHVAREAPVVGGSSIKRRRQELRNDSDMDCAAISRPVKNHQYTNSFVSSPFTSLLHRYDENNKLHTPILVNQKKASTFFDQTTIITSPSKQQYTTGKLSSPVIYDHTPFVSTNAAQQRTEDFNTSQSFVTPTLFVSTRQSQAERFKTAETFGVIKSQKTNNQPRHDSCVIDNCWNDEKSNFNSFTVNQKHIHKQPQQNEFSHFNDSLSPFIPDHHYQKNNEGHNDEFNFDFHPIEQIDHSLYSDRYKPINNVNHCYKSTNNGTYHDDVPFDQQNNYDSFQNDFSNNDNYEQNNNVNSKLYSTNGDVCFHDNNQIDHNWNIGANDKIQWANDHYESRRSNARQGFETNVNGINASAMVGENRRKYRVENIVVNTPNLQQSISQSYNMYTDNQAGRIAEPGIIVRSNNKRINDDLPQFE